MVNFSSTLPPPGPPGPPAPPVFLCASFGFTLSRSVGEDGENHDARDEHYDGADHPSFEQGHPLIGQLARLERTL